MAITWRNVVGPSVADAARPMELARQGLGDAFSQLGKVLDERIAARDSAAKEGFMNLLYGASTPEQMAALQQSGQIQQAFASLDPRIQAQVRGEEAKRLAELRTQAEAGFKYGDAMEERGARDLTAQARQTILNDPAKAGEVISQLPQRMQTELWNSLDARQQELLRRSNDATRFDWQRAEQEWKGEKHRSDMTAAEDRLKTAAAQRAMYGAQANQATAGTALARLQIDQSKAAAQAEELERNREMVRTQLVGEGSLYSGFATPEKNIDALSKVISGRKLSEDQDANLRDAIGKSLYHTYKGSDGKQVTVPVPLSILETAAQTADTWGNVIRWDKSVADNFTKRVNELMKQHEADVVRDYGALKELKRLNIQNPPAKMK